MPRAVRSSEGAKLRKPKVFHRKGQFRFMDLPAEIRIMTYRYALSPNLTRLSLLEHGLGVRRTHKDRSAQSISHQILRVSSQVYSETLPILYGDNFFQFKTFKPLELFLEQIGSGRRCIKNVEIDTFSNGSLREIKRHALVLLSESEVLKTFLISGTLCYGVQQRTVCDFHRSMAAFLHKMAAMRKSLKIAMDLVQFGTMAFQHGVWVGYKTTREREAWFRGELLEYFKIERGNWK